MGNMPEVGSDFFEIKPCSHGNDRLGGILRRKSGRKTAWFTPESIVNDSYNVIEGIIFIKLGCN